MTVNWWTVGLQAINVLILVWLLSRLFWRPVAAAIAARHTAAQALLDDAQATQTRAAAALAEVEATRKGLATERVALLAEAAAQAEAAAETALAAASDKAATVLQAAQREREREAEAARAETSADAAQLAVDIAARLLARLDGAALQPLFLDLLLSAVERLPANDKAALAGAAGGIALVSAVALDDAGRAAVTQALGKALGGAVTLGFLTDPDLIAGFELRTPHLVVHDDWRFDLASIAEDLKRAA